MSTLNELNQRLEELEIDIERAEQANAAASLALASAPHDDSAIRKARAASLHLADLRGDALLLRDARSHAEEAKRNEENQARKREADALLKKVDQLAGQRMKTAVDLDKAFAALTEAMREWVGINAKMRAHAVRFYRLTKGSFAHAQPYIEGLGSVSDGIGNALADNVDWATQGFSTHRNISLNFTRYCPDSPGSIAQAADQCSADALAALHRVAEAAGLTDGGNG
ncbi:MAG: hypothetical protein ACYC0P_02730 [Thiobacillus sp.]